MLNGCAALHAQAVARNAGASTAYAAHVWVACGSRAILTGAGGCMALRQPPPRGAVVAATAAPSRPPTSSQTPTAFQSDAALWTPDDGSSYGGMSVNAQLDQRLRHCTSLSDLLEQLRDSQHLCNGVRV
jgi:hypothetical protein